MNDPPVLLDTCALIWLANRAPVAADALERIDRASRAGLVLVSPISAWEIGLLARATHARALRFLPDPRGWFEGFLAKPGVRLAPFTPAIAIAASFLPGALQGDPADRLLVASALALGAVLATRDARLLAYAEAGHVQALRC